MVILFLLLLCIKRKLDSFVEKDKKEKQKKGRGNKFYSFNWPAYSSELSFGVELNPFKYWWEWQDIEEKG